MNKVPCESIVGLGDAQVCTRLNITYTISILGRNFSDPETAHWITIMKSKKYLQGIKFPTNL